MASRRRRRAHRRVPGVLAVAGAALLGAGCAPEAPEEAGGERLLVLAAASLNTAMPALIAAFEAHGGVGVDLVLGSTGNLGSQIESGAPADLFFAADQATVARLEGRGYLREETITTYAEGRLALVWSASAVPPTSAADVGDGAYDVLTIANPEHAPYGAAARDALRRLGLRPEAAERIVLAENVSQAYQLVRTGNADVGVVALSVVVQDRAAPAHLVLDPSLHQPIVHAAAVLRESTHPRAGEFLAFVTSDTGRSILANHGFAVPAG